MLFTLGKMLMNYFPILTVLLILLVAPLVGCSGQSFSDDYQSLYDRAADEGDNSAVQELIAGTRSRSFWDRFYAYGFLGNLTVHYPEHHHIQDRNDLLDVLATGLDEPEKEIQRVVVERLKGAGREGVVRGFDTFVENVRACSEDDVTWFSAEALAIEISAAHTTRAIQVLIEALNCDPLPEQKIPGAPQLRRFALESLVRISDRDPDSAEEMVNSIRMKVTDTAFLEEIEQALTARTRG